MELAIDATTASDAPVFDNLLQLYIHDFSEFMDLEVGADGRFAGMDVTRFWREPLRHPFLIRVDGHLAGFLIVDAQSRLWPGEPAYDVAEFFVLRKYRRLKVGTRAAAQMFDRFRGRWEVRQRARNTAATAFWRRAVGDYTGGRFRELILDEERWRGPVQLFENQ